jgi:hypothetical protein
MISQYIVSLAVTSILYTLATGVATTAAPRPHRAGEHLKTPVATADQVNIKRAQAQLLALSDVFALARHHYANAASMGEVFTINEQSRISADLDRVEKYAIDREDRMGLLYVFARSCSDYEFIASGSTGSNWPYAGIIDLAFWSACERIAKFKGEHAHAYLKLLKRELGDPVSEERMDELIAEQSPSA